MSPHDASLAASTPGDFDDAAVRNALSLPDDTLSEVTLQEMSGQNTEVVAQTVQKQQDGPDTQRPDAHSPDPDMEHIRKHSTAATVPRPSTAANAKKNNAAAQLQNELDELDHDLLSTDHTAKSSQPISKDIVGMKGFLSEVSPPEGPIIRKDVPPSRGVDTESFYQGFRFSESEGLPKTSYSSRPSTSDIWRSWRPKLKFGPRPVTDEQFHSQSTQRQKLPAGMKMKTGKSDREERPKSRKSEKSEKAVSAYSVPSSQRSKNVRNNQPPPVPPLATKLGNLQNQPTSPQTSSPSALPRVKPGGFSEGREAKRPSRINVNLITQPPQPIVQAPKSAPAITPEKQRLMRALQMRKQQQSKESPEPLPPLPLSAPPAKLDSRGPTPEAHPNVKKDSGIDVEPSVPKIESDHASPVAAPKASFTGRVNPLQSHPVNEVIHVAIPPRTQNSPNSPSPSSGSNKDLPKLPPEAEKNLSKPRNDTGRKADHAHSSKLGRPQSNESLRYDKQHEQQQKRVSGTHGSELYSEPEAAQAGEAKPLAMPPQLHDFGSSTGSPTITSVTIRSSSTQSGSHQIDEQVSRETYKAQQRQPDVEALLLRQPSNSSRPVSTRPSELDRSWLSAKRNNVTPSISRRIQALAELSHEDAHDISQHETSAYDSAQAFLAPGTLPDESSHHQSSTALGRTYEAARSRSPLSHSNGAPRDLRVRNSVQNSRTGPAASEIQKSSNPTGYRKRDSFTVTAHIMRGHQQHLQQLDPVPFFEESGDREDMLSALADRRPFSPTTEPSPATVPLSQSLSNGGTANLTFSRRDSTRPEAIRRLSSRGSAVSGRTRISLEGWRSAFASVTGGPRDSNSSSKLRPFVSRSSASEPVTAGRGQESDTALDRVDEVSEAGTRASRTSRMLKRMSHISGNSEGKLRKSKADLRSAAKQPAEDKMPRYHDPRKVSAGKGAASSGKSVIVGDLNVQFPDTLLWKRRWVEVDAAGNLVLSESSAAPGMRGGIGNAKRYHLTEFKQPVVPSRDRQEMLYSVVLDLVEGGGTLQLAAEDRVQQGALVKSQSRIILSKGVIMLT